jgi:hypothetical protein
LKCQYVVKKAGRAFGAGNFLDAVREVEMEVSNPEKRTK